MIYFQDLFKSSNPNSFTDIFQGFSPKKFHEMNSQLIKEVTAEEVNEAVFSIKPATGLGADRMTGLFYKKYWSVIGEQVIDEVHKFFVDGIMPLDWNYT